MRTLSLFGVTFPHYWRTCPCSTSKICHSRPAFRSRIRSAAGARGPSQAPPTTCTNLEAKSSGLPGSWLAYKAAWIRSCNTGKNGHKKVLIFFHCLEMAVKRFMGKALATRAMERMLDRNQTKGLAMNLPCLKRLSLRSII